MPIQQEIKSDLTAKFIDVAGTRARFIHGSRPGRGRTIRIHGGGPGASGSAMIRKNVEPWRPGRRVVVSICLAVRDGRQVKDGPIFEAMRRFRPRPHGRDQSRTGQLRLHSLGGRRPLMVAPARAGSV